MQATEPTAHAPKRRVNAVEGWRYVLLAPAFALLRLWLLTLRIRIDEAGRRAAANTREPALILMWHNRLLMAAEAHRRYRLRQTGRRLTGLISASRDGAWIAAFLHMQGIRAVRGSSSFRAAQAARNLVREIRDGHDIGITPDGPRGPRYRFASGAAMVARTADAPLFLVHVEYGRAWRFNSWDGFYLPKPFSRVEVKVDKLASWRALAEDGEDPETLTREAIRERLEQRMREHAGEPLPTG